MLTTDYIKSYFSKPKKLDFSERTDAARQAIADAEHIIIGAGAGLSAAAGLKYDGAVFENRFADFIAKYGFTDLYTSGFYPFPSEEERWAYWARHISMCRFKPGAMPLYKKLLELVDRKDYFVITTNVDAQLEKAGFDPERLFTTQGDYGYMQCSRGCHPKIYYIEDLVKRMLDNTKNCRIPSELVPHCPVCGAQMSPHLRCDNTFIQNDNWHTACDQYNNFVEKAIKGKTVLLEIGIGFNTPAIIRFPFERIASEYDNITLIRINRDYPGAQMSIKHFVTFLEEYNNVLEFIGKN